jgi:hypothetical protein
MSGNITQELTETFASASEFVQPPPGLTERVRSGVRRRRRRALAATAIATVVLLGAAATGYAAAGSHRAAARLQAPTARSRVIGTVSYQVTQLAVSGRYLYVAAGQNSWVSAYDVVTGRLIATITVPGEPVALAVGPGGLVWVGYAPAGSAAPSGIWLLSPDLRQHSGLTGLSADSIVPVSRTTALVPSRHGLLQVRLPLPGQPGQGSQHAEPGTGLGPGATTAPGAWSGMLGNRVTVQVSTGTGDNSRLVVAGQPGLTYGGSARTHINGATSTGSAVWVSTFAQINGESSLQGPLVRLNAALTPTTPPAVLTSPVLSRSEDVWSDGRTLWVATGVLTHSLVCLAAGSRTGPVVTLPVSGQVVALAAAGSTVYVNAQEPPGSTAPSKIVSYPVPAACR